MDLCPSQIIFAALRFELDRFVDHLQSSREALVISHFLSFLTQLRGIGCEGGKRTESETYAKADSANFVKHQFCFNGSIRPAQTITSCLPVYFPKRKELYGAYSMISRILNLNITVFCIATILLGVSLSGCQKVSVPRVSSKFGNVEEVSSKFVMHYLDTDPKTFASSQAQLKQDASPGLIQTMQKAGVLAKDDKAMKAKQSQLAKRKDKESVAVQKVEVGEVAQSGLIPVRVSGEIQKSASSTPFTYTLGLGIRKDNNKLAVVTITKQ